MTNDIEALRQLVILEAASARKAEAQRDALLVVAQTLLNVVDCNCNHIEWDEEKCIHDLARAAIEACK